MNLTCGSELRFVKKSDLEEDREDVNIREVLQTWTDTFSMDATS